jgi:uncharacterized membrane protein
MEIKRDTDIDTQRIETLTDGVFAIVLTLLALELSLPLISGRAIETELIPRLISLWPKFYSYVLAFLLIGMIWNGNRVEFRSIKRSDGMLVLLTTVYLLFLTLLPFSTSIIGAYPLSKLSFFIFGVNFSLILAVRIIIWRYAVAGHRLVAPDLSPQLIRTNTLVPLVGLVFAIFDCVVAVFSPITALILLYLMVVFYALVIIKGALPKLQ